MYRFFLIGVHHPRYAQNNACRENMNKKVFIIHVELTQSIYWIISVTGADSISFCSVSTAIKTIFTSPGVFPAVIPRE